MKILLEIPEWLIATITILLIAISMGIGLSYSLSNDFTIKNTIIGTLIASIGYTISLFIVGYRHYESIKDSLHKDDILTDEVLMQLGFELDGEQINGTYYKLKFAYNSGFEDYISVSNKGTYMFSLTSNYDKYFILPFSYTTVGQLNTLYLALTGNNLCKNMLPQK